MVQSSGRVTMPRVSPDAAYASIRFATLATAVSARNSAFSSCSARIDAQSIGSSFVRVENFVFSHVADEGLLVEAEAGPLLRYRRLIGAEDVRIFADIKKKHASHAITADVSLGEAAEAAAFFGADGLVISGTATGRPTNPDDVRRAKEASGLPVLVGSGANAETIGALLEHADAVIIGSATKQDGVWSHPVDAAACVRIARAASDAGF